MIIRTYLLFLFILLLFFHNNGFDNLWGMATLKRLLGFKKNELLEQNINRIIPRVIGDVHEKFMRRYFDTSESKLIDRERNIFCLHKNGYLVPCTIMIKVLPNLDDGI